MTSFHTDKAVQRVVVIIQHTNYRVRNFITVNSLVFFIRREKIKVIPASIQSDNESFFGLTNIFTTKSLILAQDER